MANDRTANKARSILLEEELQTQKKTQDVITLAAVGRKLRAITAINLAMQIRTSMASLSWVTTKDHDRKQKKR